MIWLPAFAIVLVLFGAWLRLQGELRQEPKPRRPFVWHRKPSNVTYARIETLIGEKSQ